MRMYIDIDLVDKEKLIDFASMLYENYSDMDLKKEMDTYPDDSYKIVRSLFEVLIGSQERDYDYSAAGIQIVGYGDE